MTRTILVVDDQESVRKLVSIIVRSAGYHVIEAVDGEDALIQVAGKNIDMAITDLRMPKMDGVEFVRRLRLHPEYRLTPVIMLSSEFLRTGIKDAAEAGISDWVTKPLIRHKLLNCIKGAVEYDGAPGRSAVAPA
jgi:two-component system chemotaxis response regulator CheY